LLIAYLTLMPVQRQQRKNKPQDNQPAEHDARNRSLQPLVTI
jgi:hypothetical protein